MNAAEAEQMFDEVKGRCSHVCHLPMNKQKGEKKTHAYLTCVVAMLLEDTLEGLTPLKTLPFPRQTFPKHGRIGLSEKM